MLYVLNPAAKGTKMNNDWVVASDTVEYLFSALVAQGAIQGEVDDGDFSTILAAGRDILLDGGTAQAAADAMKEARANL
jgi:hypothetical protein